VPPKNLFPERKDIPERDLRQNLITVPSCDVHNTGKSHDDEFLMVSLAGLIGNNSIGYRHNAGKVDRAVRRSANRLLQKVFVKPQKLIRFEVAPNAFMDVLWGTPDTARLARCFEGVIRGLLHHDFEKPFEGDVRVHLGFLKYEPGNARTKNEFLRKRLALDIADKPKLGGNPDVFYYQRTDVDQFGLFAYRLCFYGAVEVMAGVLPAGSIRPGNLIEELIANGTKTFVSLGPETFEFN
jgi:hypothetical protein